MAERSLRIGLTGGIASGKSTVTDLFADLGVPIIDTDVIAREVVAEGSPALTEIRVTFGAAVFDADGRLDRRRLRQVVFADDGQRRQLESILHPRIRDATLTRAEAVTAPYMIIVVPLLVESPLQEYVDRVLVVDCAASTQLARLMARDAEDEAQARRMIAAQASREERLSIADDVLQNDGAVKETRQRVRELHDRYLQLSGASPA